MEGRLDRVVSLPRESGSAEERMLRGDLVREIVARKERGKGVKRIAHELGVDRKTVRRWPRLGSLQPRRHRPRTRPIEQYREFIEGRGPEVGGNGMVLHRELVGLGFTGSYQQIQRYLKPYRAQRKWAELATMRFETGPGEQAQVDYGQLRASR
jgi:transposase